MLTKMKTSNDPYLPLPDCQRKIQPLIQQDANNKYHIPKT